MLDWVDNIRATPADKQDHIHVLYLQGGVGSGKTRAMMAPSIEILTQIPGIRILWGRLDFKDLKLSIMDKFFEILPTELIKNKSEQYHWYDIYQPEEQTGRIYFNGLKDLSGLGSQEFGVIIVNEVHEISEMMYRALKRRCRQEGVINIIMMEGEPPNEDHWLAKLTDPGNENYDPDIEAWKVSTYENWNNLPRSYTGSLETMPQAWKTKYLDGNYGFRPDGTPYYTGYREAIHAAELEWMPDKELICGWDFGFRHPACLITQVDHQDRWCWLREIIGTDITIQKFADHVKEQINLYYPNARCIHYGDPASKQHNDKSEQTSWDILLAKGIYLKYRQSEYRLRKEIIEHKLSTLNAGRPQLLVDKRFCRTANDGFLGGYHYPERKEGQPFIMKFEQPVRDGYYEHVMNSGEYIAVNMFSPITQKKSYRRPEPVMVMSNI